VKAAACTPLALVATTFKLLPTPAGTDANNDVSSLTVITAPATPLKETDVVPVKLLP
jgi:hypothetical protein